MNYFRIRTQWEIGVRTLRTRLVWAAGRRCLNPRLKQAAILLLELISDGLSAVVVAHFTDKKVLSRPNYTSNKPTVTKLIIIFRMSCIT